MTPHDWCRVSPFGHPGITAWLTAPPGLSRPPTSFIGSWCQGIHRLPYTTSQQTQSNDPQPLKGIKKLKITEKQDARVHYAHLNQQPTTTRTVCTCPETWPVCPPSVIYCLARKSKTVAGACFFRIQQGVFVTDLRSARPSPAAPTPFSMHLAAPYSRCRPLPTLVSQCLRH